MICGPAGTGKTHGILAVLHCLACDYPDLRILICRATRASLTQSVLVTYEQEILPADGMTWLSNGAARRTRSSYFYPKGTEVALGGLDKPDKILSSAWDIIYVNEAIETRLDAWEKLLSRTRRPGRPDYLGYLIGDTNPGDPSHWLKERCEANDCTMWDTSFEANPALHDGKRWTQAGLDHIANLDRLTASRKKRLRHGLWAAGEGVWFDGFDVEAHVSTDAEFNKDLRVTIGLDSGHRTGAVWLQVRPNNTITVFADYMSTGVGAYGAAKDVQRITDERCLGYQACYTDPAGKSATAIGMNVFEEYARAGLKVQQWPMRTVLDSLSLLDSFISINPPEILIHPRCKDLIAAMLNYKRATKQDQYIDRPTDPQHPYEDMVDALRGALCALFPEGRKIEIAYPRAKAGRVF